MGTMLETFKKTGIIAILRGVKLDDAFLVVEALAKGGIKGIEVSFNEPEGEKILSSLVQRFGSAVFFGAGTVLTVEEVDRAAQAGASFITSPDTDVDVIAATKARRLVSVPGALTPTEIFVAHRAGADLVKIFPSSSVGSGYIRDVCRSLEGIEFMAVGGINVDAAAAFFRSGAATIGVGADLVRKEFLEQKDWDGLCALAMKYMSKVSEGRYS